MKNKNYKDLKRSIILNDTTWNNWDQYGFCVGLHFELCEYLRFKKLSIPEHWEYKAGFGIYSRFGDLIEENPTAWIFQTYSHKTLVHLGNVLSRYARLLKHYGKDY